MPKILFIQPTQYGIDGKLCRQKVLHLPGLVFPLLKAMSPPHWQVEALIEVVDTIDYDSDADIVAIGAMGHAIYRGIEIAQEFKARGKTVVMGGYMASMVPDKVLEYVDSVVAGDAEISYPEMLKDFERDGKLKKIYDNPVDSLEGLPLPDYDLLTQKPISGMLPVQAGRGCPMTCSFCSIACLYQGRYLTRPVKEVLRDIHDIRKRGYRSFYLIDDNIIARPEYLQELCRELKPLKMKWSTQCALHLAKNRDLLKTAVDAGASMMSFGIESITQEGLDRLNKGWLNVADHEDNIRILSNAGILVSSEMIMGTDSDTEESLDATGAFVMRCRIPLPRFYILTPMPGSELYRQYRDSGRLVTEDWSLYSGSRCVHRPALISPERLTEKYWQIYRKIYALHRIILRTLLHPCFWKNPGAYLFAFVINLHYRGYIHKGVPPNIF